MPPDSGLKGDLSAAAQLAGKKPGRPTPLGAKTQVCDPDNSLSKEWIN